jgi:REP element-mobilizing transposase RayT
VIFEAWAFLPHAQRDFGVGSSQQISYSGGRQSKSQSNIKSSQTKLFIRCYTADMPNRLHRYYGAGYSHFITTSCYQRLPLLASPQNRDLFLRVLEHVRLRYRFVVVGYVVMPEHVHLLLSEQQRGDPSVVMKALKQGFARRLLSRVPQENSGIQLGDYVMLTSVYVPYTWRRASQISPTVA